MSGANRLARFLNAPGGMTVEQAEKRAKECLGKLNDIAQHDLANTVNCLRGYLALLKGAPPKAVRGELHRLAYSLAGTAGTFERPGLSDAGLAMCKVLDALEHRGAWDRAAVDVVFEAIHLLAAEQAGAESHQLTDGLRRVVAHVEHS